jgi:protein-disulfide isomerase
VNISLGTLKPSEFANYDALSIHMAGDGKTADYDFLLSRDGKTLIRMVKLDLSTDPYLEKMKKMDLSGRSVRGDKNAKVTVVNYDDFECPFCSRMHQTLFPQILKEYGDRVAFIYKDYPLTEIHPWAMRAAVDANCLAAQNGDAFWDFADYIHANQKQVSAEKGIEGQYAALDRLTNEQGQKHNLDQAKLQACIKAQNEDSVKASMHEADGLGVQATPTIFVNGQELDGAVSLEEMRATLDRALAQAGVPAPTHSSTAASTGAQPPSK